MHRYDLHIHTTHSGDCISPIEGIIAAARSKGLRGVAITDHDTVSGVKEAEKLAGRDFLIIPGVEISSRDGHILGLGIRKTVPKGLPATETVARVRKLGGIAVAAHPFGFGLRPFAVLKADYDAIEVYNPRRYFANRIARRYAEREGLAVAAGSDAHHPCQVGLAGIEVRGKPTVRDVLKQVKAGKAGIFGRSLPPREYLRRIMFRIRHLK